MKRRDIVINGKFLLASLEGMPRVGREITKSIDDLLDLDKYRSLSVSLAVARGGKAEASYRNIEIVEVGRYKGQVWEQIEFPLHVGRRYSLNFTSTAPIIKRYGCVVVHDAQFRSTVKSHSVKSYLLYNVITSIASRRYKTILTVSNYARDEILKYKVCDRDDIRVAPNGADHVLRYSADPGLLQKFGLEPQSYALANSYFHAHKNVRVLLEAFAAGPPDRQLVLFGTAVRKDYDERGIPVPDNVKFLGRVSDAELVALMASARMFLFPSTTEGFGLPPLEAMMLGCPTICAPAGAMPENCGDGALYADPSSPEAWLEAITRLWDQPEERRRLGEAGKQRASQFQWSRSAALYLDAILSDL